MAIDMNSWNNGAASGDVKTVVVDNSSQPLNLNLHKTSEKPLILSFEKKSNIDEIITGMSWDPNTSVSNGEADLDIYGLALSPFNNGTKTVYNIKALDDVVYWDELRGGNTKGYGFTKSADNQTGEGDGDDEWLKVKLSGLKNTVDRFVVIISIYEASKKMQTFGSIKNAKFYLKDVNTGNILATFDLTNDYSTYTSLLAGEFVRTNDGWVFNFIGEGNHEEWAQFGPKYQSGVE